MRRLALLTTLMFLLLVTAQAIQPVIAVDSTETVTPTITRTPDATEVAYATVIRADLQSLSIVQNVIFDEQDSSRVLTITFTTTASTSADRVTEWMSILDPLSATIHDQALDVTTISLVASNADGLVGQFTTTATDLASYYSKQITRTQFLNSAKYLSLLPTPTITPTLSKDEAQGTLVHVAYGRQQTATSAAFNVRATQLARTAIAQVQVSSGSGGKVSSAVCPNTSDYCSQLTCAQAYACLAAGDSRIDGDHDDKPCESQCGG